MLLMLMLALLLMLATRETTKEVGGEIPKATRLLGSVGGTRPLPCPPFFGQLQGVLQSTGAFQYVGIVWMAVALTAHLDVTKLVGVVQISLTFPLHVDSIPAFVFTLNSLWDKCSAASRAPDTLDLGYGAGAARGGEAALVQSQHLDVPQQDAARALIPTFYLYHKEKMCNQ